MSSITANAPEHDLLRRTIGAWESWSAMHDGYDGPWRDLVRHSGRVLRALTFTPTGALVAALQDHWWVEREENGKWVDGRLAARRQGGRRVDHSF